MDASPGERASGAKFRIRGPLIAGTGFTIIAIGLAAALLPLAGRVAGASLVGAMMICAGLAEMAGGSLRSAHRLAAILPGAVTVAAGFLFSAEPFDAFLAMVHLVIGWLAARAALLLVASLDAKGPVRLWSLIAAGTDLSLAAILFIGLTATSFPIALFGVSKEIFGGFAWVLALSFVVTGLLLIEIGAFEASRNVRNQHPANRLAL